MSGNQILEQLDFAVIGHQESWDDIASFMNGMRSSELPRLSLKQIKDTFPYIPPRDVFKMEVISKTGTRIKGVYIETFIEPDKLTPQYLRTNIAKVNEAIAVAQRLKAGIIALGGFTSIVLEGNLKTFDTNESKITTGNSLTSAYIVKGIEKVSEKLNLNIKTSNVLIIGASGDIGMACTDYLKNNVKCLLLCARNKRRLEGYANQISREGFSVRFHTDVSQLLPQADIVISVASSQDIEITNYKNPVIICDAGYPKNLEATIDDRKGISLFHGGMGHISYGYKFSPDYTEHFYRYPLPHIGHGCILEAVVLAFEKKFENYSSGKGNIGKKQIDEIYAMSIKHGLELAPFYNSNGLWA